MKARSRARAALVTGVLASVALLTGCAAGELAAMDSSPATSPDANAIGPVDAQVDTGAPGTPDATVPYDAGAPPPVDGGSQVDTGVHVDSGAPIDSGVHVDSAAPVDSGYDSGYDSGWDSGYDAGYIAPGSQPVGNGCTQTSDCQSSLQCIFGACHKTCTITCSGGALCLVGPNDAGFCSVNCSLSGSTACGGANCAGGNCAACVALTVNTGTSTVNATDCEAAGGTGTQGSTCTASTTSGNGGCEQGYTCGGQCAEWCSSGITCPGLTTCNTTGSNGFAVGGTTYGLCL